VISKGDVMNSPYKNKRGISQLIATVLILMLTVSTVAIVWSVISPIITGKIEASAECRVATSALALDKFCVKTHPDTNEEIFLTISRNSEKINLIDLQFVVGNKQGNSDSVFFTHLANTTVDDLPGPNEGITIIRGFNQSDNINLYGKYNALALAPVIQIKNNQSKTCEIVRRVRLREC